MYSPESPLTPYSAPHAAWRGVLAQHGAVGGAAAIVASYAHWCRMYDIDANLALSQGCQESAYFTSERWVNEWNPAGLGVTSNTTPPNPFGSFDEGIRAHIEHLCCYAYATDLCPVDHQHLVDRRHFFHAAHNSIAGLEAGPKWAVPGTGYVAAIVRIANDVTGGAAPPQTGGRMRIIVHAGHQNIGSITADKIGQASANTLRGGTGANGEMQWNAACADELTRLLAAARVDAVRTDAIYHADVYGPDADLCVAIHYDGVSGTGRAQYCMAATVHSGPSTEEADSRADVIVREWYGTYPAAMGIAGNGPITDGMQQYYGGWYRSANTPMLLIEHCIGADGGGIRADRPRPEAAALADFMVLNQHFHFGGVAPVADVRTFPETGHGITGPFKGHWEQFEDDDESLALFGFPISDTEPGLCEDGVTRTVQWFERARFEDWGGGDVRRSRLGAMALRKLGRHGPGLD